MDTDICKSFVEHKETDSNTHFAMGKFSDSGQNVVCLCVCVIRARCHFGNARQGKAFLLHHTRRTYIGHEYMLSSTALEERVGDSTVVGRLALPCLALPWGRRVPIKVHFNASSRLTTMVQTHANLLPSGKQASACCLIERRTRQHHGRRP